jgi:hypothetical protein
MRAFRHTVMLHSEGPSAWRTGEDSSRNHFDLRYVAQCAPLLVLRLRSYPHGIRNMSLYFSLRLEQIVNGRSGADFNDNNTAREQVG